ncbi:two-partner secretion domain-containing protein, partial [Oligella urethralis]|uniref:two-partner secretion domain-containing protein n=1 Tax=Oligella urethralis TaxID=90245 RepID=UPI00288AB494
MNNSFYKIIFNKSRGQLMVVSEIAQGQGKNTAKNCAVSVSSSPLYAPLKVMVLSLLLATGVLFDNEAGAQIRADKAAPTHQQATILQTANGLDQVNIQTPTAAGVSVNQFSQFDVQQQGAILNNSRQSTQTQLAGWVQGNQHLARGEASVIVNQVNSRAPSRLQGFTEVAGRRAEVVIANPAGIAVDGGGFINAQGVTLATGQMQINAQGRLTGVAVNQGTVQVLGGGLNTKDANYTQILSHAATIEGGIWANDLSVSTGEQDIVFDAKDLNQSAKLMNQADTQHRAATAERDAKQSAAIAIDVAQLGGMYANSIVLISNDKGVGVNNSGQLYAGAGRLQLSADGQLSNSGEMVASAANTAEPVAKVQITSTSLQNQGTIAAPEVSIKAAQIHNTKGFVTASKTLQIESTELANTEQAQLKAGRLDIQTERLENIQSGIVQTGTQALNINSAALTNSGQLGTAVISDPVSSDIDPENPSSGDAPSPTEPGQQTPSSSTALGKTTTETVVSPALAAGRIQVERNITNDEGQISANGDVHLSLSQALHNQGDIQVKNLQSKGEQLRNAGYINAERLDLEHRHLDNRQGHLYSSNAISLATETLDNRAGQISTRDSLLIDNQGRLDNSQGQLLAAQAITLNTQEMQNTQGQLVTGKSLSVSVEEVLHDQQGQWQALEALRIHAGELQSEQSRFSTDDELHLASQGQLVLTEAQLSAQHSLQLQGDGVQMKDTEAFAEQLQVLSSGELQSQGAQWQAQQVQVEAVDWQNLQGEIVAEKDLIIRSNSLDNQQGRLVSGEVMSVHLDQDLINQQGLLQAGQALDIRARNLHSEEGTLAAQGPAQLAIAEIFDQSGGLTTIGGKLMLSSRRLINRGGHLESAQSLALHVDEAIDNTEGRLQTLGDMEVMTAGQVVNTQGQLMAGEALTLHAERLDTQAGQIASTGALTLTVDDELNANQAQLVSNKSLKLQAASLDASAASFVTEEQMQLNVRDKLLAQDSQWQAGKGIALNADSIDLTSSKMAAAAIQASAHSDVIVSSGLLQADESMLLQAKAVKADHGYLSAGERVQVNASQLFDHQQGTLLSGGDVQLDVGQFLNEQGSLYAASTIQIDATQDIKSVQSDIQSGGELLVRAAGSIHQGGRLLAAEQLTLQAQQLQHEEAQLQGHVVTLQSADGLHLRDSTLLSATQVQLHSGGDSYLDETTVQAEDDVEFRAQARADLKQSQLHSRQGSVLLDAQESHQQDSQLVAKEINLSLSNELKAEDGYWLAEEGLTIQTPTLQMTSMNTQADTLTIQSVGDVLHDQSVTVVDGELRIDAKNLSNHAGQLVSAKRLEVTASGTVDNSAGLMISDGQMVLNQESLINTKGKLHAAENLTIQASQGIDSLDSEIVSAESIQIQAATKVQLGGVLFAEESLDVEGFEQRYDAAHLQAKEISLSAQGDLALTKSTLLAEEAASLVSGANLSLNEVQGQAQGVFTIDVEEQATLEQSDLQSVGGPLSIRAATQQHHQSTLLAEDIKLTAGQTLGAETSQWVAHNNLDLAVGSLDLTQHQSQAEAIQLNSQGRIEQQDSLMQADKTLEIKAQALTNRGSDITAGTDLVIKTSGHVDNHEGLLLADGSLKIQAAELRNEQGRVASQGSTELGIDGLLNNQQGLIATSDELILHVGSLHNQAGQVSTKQAMKVVVGEEFNNQAGLVVSDASFDLNVGHLFNQAGQLQAKTDFHLTAKQAIDNLQGEIVAGGSANLHSQGALVNSGVIAAGDTLAIQAEQITQEGGHLQAEQLALKAKQAIAMSDESTVLATDSAELSAGTNLSLADTQIQTLNKLQLQAGQKIAMQDTDLQSQQGDVSLDAKSIVQANTTLGGKNLALSASDNIQAEDSQWLADSTLQATSDVLNLHRLSSAAEQIKLQANQGLKHHDSVMVAEQSVHLQAAAMTNQGGQIAAGENLQINAGQLLDNQEGALVAQQDLQITASIVTNQQGKLSAQQDLQVTASQSVNNQSGLMVADGALLLSSPIVINKGGQISAANLLAINNNTSFDNQSGLLVSDGDIRLETSSLENSRGQIHAKGNTTIQASQRITNHGGEILAAKTVSLLDSAQQRNQRRLQIEQDANGVIQGNEGTVLIAQELRSQARIETPGHLQLDVTEGFNNLGGLQAGGSLSLITDKHLHNTQTIYSPDALTVQASDIHNDSTGELLGETAVTVVAKTGDIVNRGLINSNGVTTVEAAGTIDNIGSGRIYGDHVAIQSKTLLNREEVQATGERKAAVIAARERLDIGVHSLRNQEEGLLFSGGDLAIAARLDVNKQAQGQASNLINSAATIESLGDMYLNVHSIRNLNPDFELTRVQVSTPERFDFIVHDGQGYETRVDKKDLKERRWSRRAWEFVSKEPGDYANLVPGETPLWSLAQPACYSFSGNDCFTSTQLTNYEKYSPDNPAWAYFGITPGIATEPLAPRAPTEPTVSEPSKSCTFISDSDDRRACSSATQAWRDYRQNLASYQEQYAQYQVAYDTWMQVDGQRWHALDQAITAYNKDYQHQFKHRYTEYWITRTEYEDQVAHSRPGDIIAGGNLTINADTLTNDKSRIVAGKALKVDARHIDNIDAKGLRIIEDEGTSRYAWERWRGGLRRYHQREHGPVTPFLMTEQSTIDLPVSVYQAYSQVSSTGVSPNQLAEQAEVAAKKQLASGQASDMEQAAFESDVSVARQESEHSIGQDVSQLDREAFNGSQTESLVESDVAQQLAQGKDAVAPLDDTTTMDLLMDRERPLGSTNGDKGNATIDVLMQSLAQEEISTLSPTQVDTPTITTPQAPSYLVPTSSLYSVDPTRTRYLVETDPAFANQRQWLSSDYMLQALNQDPARMQKRLGDGYYEQRLLREQILQLTGQRFLDGYDNDEEQFKALMEQGVSFAMTQGLTPGIELTAAQVARLTSDIVWLESQTVTLANGTTQEVLVPRVYVKPRQGDLAQSGALLAGNTVELQVKDGFINSGTVAGREIVSIKADTIDQEFARIQAKRVELVADRDITLAGSTVSAEELASIRAGNQLDIKSTTYHTQADVAGTNGSHFSGERQGIDRLASIHVSGDEAQLLLSAAKDMILTGALVSHSGRDGLTYLGAGDDLQLDTVTVGYRQDSVGSASHYIKEQRWQDVGTEIQAVGDIILDAGNDARLTAARITSDDGLVQLRAQQDIEIGAGTLSSQLDERHLTKSRSLLGSKSKDRHWIQDSEQALGSEVTGREVLLQSGQDLRVIGSDVISDEGTYLQAGRDISLAGAEEYAFSDYHEKTKRSGVFGTGGIGVTIGSQSTEIDHERSDGSLRGTLVGSLAGDTVIEAGRQYSQEASTVSSPEGHVLITGQVLEIAAGKEGYSEHYRRVDKQSGLTVAVNVPVVEALRKVAHAVESIGESSNRRTQAMAAANTAWSAYEGLGQLMDAPV